MEYRYFGGIFFLLAHLLAVSALTLNVTETNNDCYWSGSAPICNGKCRLGEILKSESHKNDGNGCLIGKMSYCCKTSESLMIHSAGIMNNTFVHESNTEKIENNAKNNSAQLATSKPPTLPTQQNILKLDNGCYWVGTSPFCEGSCGEGEYVESTSRTGDGSMCVLGKKKHCCKGTAPQPTVVPATNN